jgi:hypothetical protein
MRKISLVCSLLLIATTAFSQLELLETSTHSVSIMDTLQNKSPKPVRSQSLVANEAAIVGEHIKGSFASPSPYQGNPSRDAVLAWSDVIHYESGTYIAPYFSMMDLGPGDYVVLRAPDNSRKWVYENTGVNGQGTKGGFWGIPIYGNTAIVELYVTSDTGGQGYAISQFARGFTRTEMGFDEGESICTADDTQEAKCFMNSEPEVYDKARAVVRIISNGNAHCTGWIVGDEGHILTNEHCVTDQAGANNLTLELMAEGPDCATDCSSSLGCPGIIEATGPTFIKDSAPLDYALLLPTGTVNNLPDTYGFMQLRASGAVLNEQIYIPQHPAGWGKRVAFSSSYPDDVNGNAGLGQVNSVTEAACSAGGPQDVGYWLDTQGGSSGSPVLGYSDHKIVALHHCRGSGFCTSGGAGDDPNRGVPIQNIIADLGADLPNGAVCDSPDAPTAVTATANGDNQIDVSWTAPAAGGPYTYDVYRSLGGCQSTTYEKVAEGVNGTNFSDTDVSGGSEYSYKIKTYDVTESCTSAFSSCDAATATGLCTLSPTFSGVTDVSNQKTGACAIQVDWSQSTANCGNNVVYNVYRSMNEEFTPTTHNMISSCETGNTFTDSGVTYGEEFFYKVLAEDNSGNGAGHCAGGNQNTDLPGLSALATGPDLVLFSDDIENGAGNWSLSAGSADTGRDPWEITSSNSSSPANSWFVSDEASTKDQNLALAQAVNITEAGYTLRFNHNFNTESTWDGGAIEFSTDGGTTWFDILDGNGSSVPANANRFVQNGYNSSLRGGPLNGRDAYSGDNGGWEQVIVNLNDFVGESVLFRWRMSCDGSVSDEGWYVDDVEVVAPTQCTFDDLIFGHGFDGAGN